MKRYNWLNIFILAVLVGVIIFLECVFYDLCRFADLPFGPIMAIICLVIAVPVFRMFRAVKKVCKEEDY